MKSVNMIATKGIQHPQSIKYVNMKCGLLVILPHGLYGLHDLRDFVVHHAPQHAVSNSISVHNDPGGKRIVVLQIGL